MKNVIPRRVTESNQALLERLERPAAAPDAEILSASDLLMLLADVQAADDFELSVRSLCRGLATWSGATRVVLGLANSQGNVRVSAISDAANLDKRSELMHAFEAALDETLAQGKLISWTPAMAQSGPIFQRLTRLASADAVIGLPLRNARGGAVGAILLCGDSGWHARLLRSQALELCQRPIANCLALLQNMVGGRWQKLRAAWRTPAGHVRAKVFAATVVLAASVLLFPMPFKVKCDFTVEPVIRRYVAAPFDGTLDQTFVEPGNIVTAGQVLAVMDERELRLELAGLEAEISVAKKKRVAALAGGEAATAQLAALELAQLETKLESVNQRLANLSIQCPTDGVVVSGDLRRTEGAPLSIGQTLFEIAPLDRMFAEIAVPQDEISHVRPGMPVDLRFDAYPGQSWAGELHKVHPRAELRDSATVFIAEVHLENPDNRLSPGMSGRAKIKSNNRMLGWILFHRSANALAQRMGW